MKSVLSKNRISGSWQTARAKRTRLALTVANLIKIAVGNIGCIYEMQRVENLLFIFFGEDSETTGIRVTPAAATSKQVVSSVRFVCGTISAIFARAGIRCVYRKGLPIEQNGPSLRRKLRGKRFHQGRFTRAVRADKRQNLSAFGGEFYMLQKRRIVADRKVVRFTIAHAAASLLWFAHKQQNDHRVRRKSP